MEEIAVVTNVVGEAWMRAEDGTLVPLQVGDKLPLDAVVVTGGSGVVSIESMGIPPIVIGSSREVALGQDIVQDTGDTFSVGAAASDSAVFTSEATSPLLARTFHQPGRPNDFRSV